MTDLLLVLLGAALAVLSPALVEAIRRARERGPIRRAIEVELDELRYTMAALAYRLRSHTGTLDHKFISWQIGIETCYTGPDRDPSTLGALRGLLATPEPALLAGQQARLVAGKSLTVKRYHLPYLATQLTALRDLPQEFQRGVLQVQAQLELLNEDVPYLQSQHQLTFAALPSQNHQIVLQNIRDGYNNMARQAQGIADQITQVTPLERAQSLAS